MTARDDLVPLYPSYDVVIIETAARESKRVHMDLPWYDHSLFWWTQGNFSCDCNRGECVWQRDKNAEETVDVPCGSDKYIIIKAIFPDGTECLIDGNEAA